MYMHTQFYDKDIHTWVGVSDREDYLCAFKVKYISMDMINWNAISIDIAEKRTICCKDIHFVIVLWRIFPNAISWMKMYQLIIQIMPQIFQLVLLSTYELFQRWIETASIDVHSTSFLPLQSSLLSGMKGHAKK